MVRWLVPASWRRPAPEGLGRILGLAALGLICLIYVANAWTPSHYGEATRMLGIPRSGPVLGESHPIRSDEWAVTTPYFQIAVANDLGPRDRLSPYREPLKAFFALPSRDWSMAFKPDLWGFLALDPAHAYSLHYLVLALSMVGGFAVLLRQLGCSGGFALAASILLFLTQFVQVWWTSNAPALAFAPWPAVAYLWRGPWPARTLAVALAIAVWLIGQLYPPFILAAGLALAVLIAAFRPEALAFQRLAPALAGAALGAGLAWLHLGDLIEVMAATVYPGARVVDGGGVHPLQMLANLFPYLVVTRFEPLPLWPTNPCEIAAVGSLLPLAAACFCDHRRLAAWAKTNRWSLAVWIAGLCVMAGWMLAPIPGRWAPVLNLIPPNRMMWGFGLALMLGCAVVADAAPWRLSARRIGAFVLAVIGAWAVSKLALSPQPLALGRFDLAAVPILLAVLLASRRLRTPQDPRRLVVIALLVTAAATFGRFNPVQSAKVIFAPKSGPVLETFRAYAAAHPRGWVAAPGMYGAVLNGAGVGAINHTLLRPQPEVFGLAYPDLDAKTFNRVFNRYAHVAPRVQWAPSVVQADLVALPPDPFAISLPVEVAAPATGLAKAGALETVETVRLGPGRWGVTASGWAPWSGVAAGQGLRVALLDPDLVQIVGASAYRLPRPDIVLARNDPQAFAAGFGLRLEIESKSPPDGRAALVVVGVDPGRGGWLIGPGGPR